MKKLILPFVLGVSIFTLGCFVHAQTHDSSLDGKSVSSITFDNANSPGTVKVKSPTGMTSSYTLTLPAETGTILTSASTGTSTQTITLSGATTGSGTTSIATTLANTITKSANVNWSDINGIVKINTGAMNWPNMNNDMRAGGFNWTDIRAYGTSHGGNNSGINWQSFGV